MPATHNTNLSIVLSVAGNVSTQFHFNMSHPVLNVQGLPALIALPTLTSNSNTSSGTTFGGATSLPPAVTNLNSTNLM